MRSISISNHKGGVGKTTTALNLGAGLARLGEKVLLIDMDPQAHLTYSLGIEAHELETSVHDIMKGLAKIEDLVITREGLDLIPSSLDLSGKGKRELMSLEKSEWLLSNGMDGADKYDYIIIDCPPALGIFTLNALTFSQEIFVPLQAEFLSLQGMSKLLKWVKQVQKRYNEKLEISGVIITCFDKRKRLNQEVDAKVRSYFKNRVFETQIRENISLAEAPGFGQSIFEYDSGSHGAEDYMNLSREVMERSSRYEEEREAGVGSS